VDAINELRAGHPLFARCVELVDLEKVWPDAAGPITIKDCHIKRLSGMGTFGKRVALDNCHVEKVELISWFCPKD
jgi:hypothetical protein